MSTKSRTPDPRPQTRSAFFVSTVLLFAASATAAAAFGPGGPQGPPPPPQVTVVPVESRTVPVEYEYLGVTQPSKTVEIRARVQGFIETRNFEEGALVQPGDLLFTIDPRPFKADRDIALAQVEQAESRLRLAEQEVKRLRSVREPGSIAAADLDQRIAEQTNAAAALRLAKAQLAKAELQLDYTTVKAPITGLIGKSQKEIGSMVDAAQNSLLTVIQQCDPLYVSFQVTESDYLEWRRDVDAGKIVLADGRQEPYLEMILVDGTTYGKQGRINFENAAVNVQTGTVELRGVFENPGHALKPGQFMKVRLKGWQRPDTLSVPQRAVNQSPQGAFVYVVGADNKAERRAVQLGRWSGRDWIITGGVKPGERVIVEGLTKIMMPGMPVVPVAPGAEPTAPTPQTAALPGAQASK